MSGSDCVSVHTSMRLCVNLCDCVCKSDCACVCASECVSVCVHDCESVSVCVRQCLGV